MIPQVGRGTALRAPDGRGPQVSLRAETTYTIIVIAKKNSPIKVKRAHFRYILGPPGPT